MRAKSCAWLESSTSRPKASPGCFGDGWLKVDLGSVRFDGSRFSASEFGGVWSKNSSIITSGVENFQDRGINRHSLERIPQDGVCNSFASLCHRLSRDKLRNISGSFWHVSRVNQILSVFARLRCRNREFRGCSVFPSKLYASSHFTFVRLWFDNAQDS